ncbi:WhiB family transcriptional regulator [Streptomyces sp. NPDC005803]|uniref:WhiB family transcriptional regulator n=1 Tax=Streptomyces sp. NPDC005803 TaxID=3154297 RepID=UPI0033C40563
MWRRGAGDGGPGRSAPAWQHRSLCRFEDPELFFPIGEAGPALGQIAEAKAVCGQCPVIRTCRAWALDHREETGVWGGLSEHERRTIRQREARAARHVRAPL